MPSHSTTAAGCGSSKAHTYPLRAPEGQGQDRILILEDTNGDGRLDSRKVFIENLNLVSGIEVGFGGVWVGAAPYLLFIPIKDGTDVPAGPPQVMLDGWGYEDTHETLNTFTWGPDGWLYGTHGVFTHSNVGKPGTPESERTKLDAGVWRFHPTKHAFEVFAEGTSNPWGLDFNDYGHAFMTACVIEHLYHIVQGARLQAAGGRARSTRTSTTTSRPSPITCTGSGRRGRTRETAARQPPAAVTRTPGR